MAETKKEKPSWIKLKPKEIEEKIIELAKEGSPPEKIGLILRDKHAVPKTRQIIEKKISEVLKEAGIEYRNEKVQLSKKIQVLKSHLEKNKHDNSAHRSLTKKLWTLNKLQKLQS